MTDPAALAAKPGGTEVVVKVDEAFGVIGVEEGFAGGRRAGGAAAAGRAAPPNRPPSAAERDARPGAPRRTVEAMTYGETHPPDWYPDPYGRHELRYYDGAHWTDHVSSHGRQAVDPPGGTLHVPTVDRPTDKIQRDVARAGASPAPYGNGGGGSIFTEPVLVVSQKAKIIEISNEYAIYDREGRQIAAVRQVGQSMAKKVLRVVSSLDQFMTHKLQVVDMEGRPILALTRPAKIAKSRVVVQDGAGRELGEIVQENMIGKIRFGMMAGGRRVGSLNAENWRAWNFNIQDGSGTEVARITKTWEGLAKTMFTTADNYVAQIHRPLDEPLRSLVVASALTVDTALKQDARGFG